MALQQSVKRTLVQVQACIQRSCVTGWPVAVGVQQLSTFARTDRREAAAESARREGRRGQRPTNRRRRGADQGEVSHGGARSDGVHWDKLRSLKIGGGGIGFKLQGTHADLRIDGVIDTTEDLPPQPTKPIKVNEPLSSWKIGALDNGMPKFGPSSNSPLNDLARTVAYNSSIPFEKRQQLIQQLQQTSSGLMKSDQKLEFYEAMIPKSTKPVKTDEDDFDDGSDWRE